jgi:hypothetical protein
MMMTGHKQAHQGVSVAVEVQQTAADGGRMTPAQFRLWTEWRGHILSCEECERCLDQDEDPTIRDCRRYWGMWDEAMGRAPRKARPAKNLPVAKVTKEEIYWQTQPMLATERCPRCRQRWVDGDEASQVGEGTLVHIGCMKIQERDWLDRSTGESL